MSSFIVDKSQEDLRGPKCISMHFEMPSWTTIYMISDFSSYDFTWCNNREGDDDCRVEERLDCFCASMEWVVQFPKAEVQHNDSNISGHLPILL